MLVSIIFPLNGAMTIKYEVFFPTAAWNTPRDIAIDFFQIGKIIASETCVKSSSANLDRGQASTATSHG